MPKLIGDFNIWVRPNMVIYIYGLGHYGWRLVIIGILDRSIMISHGIEIVCSIR